MLQTIVMVERFIFGFLYHRCQLVWLIENLYFFSFTFILFTSNILPILWIWHVLTALELYLSFIEKIPLDDKFLIVRKATDLGNNHVWPSGIPYCAHYLYISDFSNMFWCHAKIHHWIIPRIIAQILTYPDDYQQFSFSK